MANPLLDRLWLRPGDILIDQVGSPITLPATLCRDNGQGLVITGRTIAHENFEALKIAGLLRFLGLTTFVTTYYVSFSWKILDEDHGNICKLCKGSGVSEETTLAICRKH